MLKTNSNKRKAFDFVFDFLDCPRHSPVSPMNWILKSAGGRRQCSVLEKRPQFNGLLLVVVD